MSTFSRQPKEVQWKMLEKKLGKVLDPIIRQSVKKSNSFGNEVPESTLYHLLVIAWAICEYKSGGRLPNLRESKEALECWFGEGMPLT